MSERLESGSESGSETESESDFYDDEDDFDSEGEEEEGGEEPQSDDLPKDQLDESLDEPSQSVSAPTPEAESSSGDEAESCPICLLKLRLQNLGRPEPCQHIFCLTCIREWAKVTPSCPIDRIEFSSIAVRPDGGETETEMERVKKAGPPTQPDIPDEEGEEETSCEICQRGDREHILLLCDSCDLAYHTTCLTPALAEVPRGRWHCPTCTGVGVGEAFVNNTAETRPFPRVPERRPRARTSSRRRTPRRGGGVIPRTSQLERIRRTVDFARRELEHRIGASAGVRQRKRKTTRKSTKKSARTKASGSKSSGKPKPRRRRKRKTRRRRAPTSRGGSNRYTYRDRHQDMAVMESVRQALGLPEPDVHWSREVREGLTITGRDNDLDYFDDDSPDEMIGVGGGGVSNGGFSSSGGVVARVLPRHVAVERLNLARRRRVKAGVELTSVASGPADLLGDILGSQNTLLNSPTKPKPAKSNKTPQPSIRNERNENPLNSSFNRRSLKGSDAKMTKAPVNSTPRSGYPLNGGFAGNGNSFTGRSPGFGGPAGYPGSGGAFAGSGGYGGGGSGGFAGSAAGGYQGSGSYGGGPPGFRASEPEAGDDLYGNIEEADPTQGSSMDRLNLSSVPPNTSTPAKVPNPEDLYDPADPGSDDENLVIDDSKPEEIPMPSTQSETDPMDDIPLPEGEKPHKIKIQLKSNHRPLTSTRNLLKDKKPVTKKKKLLADIFGSDDEVEDKGEEDNEPAQGETEQAPQGDPDPEQEDEEAHPKEEPEPDANRSVSEKSGEVLDKSEEKVEPEPQPEDKKSSHDHHERRRSRSRDDERRKDEDKKKSERKSSRSEDESKHRRSRSREDRRRDDRKRSRSRDDKRKDERKRSRSRDDKLRDDKGKDERKRSRSRDDKGRDDRKRSRSREDRRKSHSDSRSKTDRRRSDENRQDEDRRKSREEKQRSKSREKSTKKSGKEERTVRDIDKEIQELEREIHGGDAAAEGDTGGAAEKRKKKEDKHVDEKDLSDVSDKEIEATQTTEQEEDEEEGGTGSGSVREPSVSPIESDQSESYEKAATLEGLNPETISPEEDFTSLSEEEEGEIKNYERRKKLNKRKKELQRKVRELERQVIEISPSGTALETLNIMLEEGEIGEESKKKKRKLKEKVKKKVDKKKKGAGKKKNKNKAATAAPAEAEAKNEADEAEKQGDEEDKDKDEVKQKEKGSSKKEKIFKGRTYRGKSSTPLMDEKEDEDNREDNKAEDLNEDEDDAGSISKKEKLKRPELARYDVRRVLDAKKEKKKGKEAKAKEKDYSSDSNEEKDKNMDKFGRDITEKKKNKKRKTSRSRSRSVERGRKKRKARTRSSTPSLSSSSSSSSSSSRSPSPSAKKKRGKRNKSPASGNAAAGGGSRKKKTEAKSSTTKKQLPLSDKIKKKVRSRSRDGKKRKRSVSRSPAARRKRKDDRRQRGRGARSESREKRRRRSVSSRRNRRKESSRDRRKSKNKSPKSRGKQRSPSRSPSRKRRSSAVSRRSDESRREKSRDTTADKYGKLFESQGGEKSVYSAGDKIMVSVNFGEKSADNNSSSAPTATAKKPLKPLNLKPSVIIDILDEEGPYRIIEPPTELVDIASDTEEQQEKENFAPKTPPQIPDDLPSGPPPALEDSRPTEVLGPKTPPNEPETEHEEDESALDNSFKDKPETCKPEPAPVKGPMTPPEPDSYDPFEPTDSPEREDDLLAPVTPPLQPQTPPMTSPDLTRRPPSPDGRRPPSPPPQSTIPFLSSPVNGVGPSTPEPPNIQPYTRKPLYTSLPANVSAAMPETTYSNRSLNVSSGSPVDMDLDSPFSPGSGSDLSDLFEPPSSGTPPVTALTRSGVKPSESSQWAKIIGDEKKAKKSAHKHQSKSGRGKKTVATKVVDDRLKIIDEVPSSAVEMFVKEKFLKKVQRQERIVEEVKLVLKPAYNTRKITKEQYKEILRKAVPKICHSKHGEINPSKIGKLVNGYVKKYHHQKKKMKASKNNTF